MFVTAQLLVVTDPVTSILGSDEEIAQLAEERYLPGEGRTEVERLSAENPALPLWLDWHLAQAAFLEQLTWGSNPVVVFVETPPGSHGANHVQLALRHLRSFNRSWLRVVIREADGRWVNLPTN